MPLIAQLSDISSNARVKEYPSQTVLQVANAPIFRERGFEPQTRLYDVPPKGNAKDPERSLESSRARARAAIRDIALCNRFEYFFTWTLDSSKIDRYDASVVGRKVQTFLKNASYRKGFQYLCVPEFHKDGAIHLHGLCNLGQAAIERACDHYTGKTLFTDRDQPIFNMQDWKYGYSTCIPIDGNYEKTCNYLVKYISKDSVKIFGKWYFSSRDLSKKPQITLIAGGIDYYDFICNYPDLPNVPVYRDVRMSILQQPHNGEELNDETW